ncbi:MULTISPECIES: hypothetical protein [Bradyrhizobium]|uniref:hypothetical protein n=1 Tax=Bradyrhizobium centrosematis TaxID=1300039 RepID=UPI00216A7978|nr:hypothetical protein [Bradyrhizobium centrosematis]MCS3765508.1 hypothetical protein [Bradyrhizobium centrosematis]MCS3778042.1 hypothetical protein [Bradyrhizobium centrosematis]
MTYVEKPRVSMVFVEHRLDEQLLKPGILVAQPLQAELRLSLPLTVGEDNDTPRSRTGFGAASRFPAILSRRCPSSFRYAQRILSHDSPFLGCEDRSAAIKPALPN